MNCCLELCIYSHFYAHLQPAIQVHCSLEDCPFAYDTNELIDFDATFKEAYDTSTYKLYVGCTGCMPEPEDPITIAPLAVAYSPAKVEPFTQHSYRSLAGVDKKFSSSKIDPAVCPNGHWGIRLVTFPNASTMYWGAVVGLGALRDPVNGTSVHTCFSRLS